MLKYHLGCGKKYMKGYVNVDHPSSKGKTKADRHEDLLSMTVEPCEEIRSHHVFEHFGYITSLVLLVKWTKALKVGGKILIDVPDISAIAHNILKNQANVHNTLSAMRLIYGDQQEDWAFHYNGWTEESLSDILRILGFNVSVKKYVRASENFPNYGFELSGIKNFTYTTAFLAGVASTYLSYYYKLPSEKERYQVMLKRLHEKVAGYA